MKKLLLTLAAVFIGLTAFADPVTFNFVPTYEGSGNNITNIQYNPSDCYGLSPLYSGSNTGFIKTSGSDVSGNVATNGGITVTFNGESSSWRLWNDGLRAYKNKNASFTITSTSGNIKGVTWTCTNAFTLGTANSTTAINYWEGDASSVTLEYLNPTSNLALSTLTVAIGNDQITIPQIPTYTVAQAISAIDENNIGTAIVTGIISSIASSKVNSDGQISYFIKDNLDSEIQFEAYNGLGLNGATFSALTDITVGATVKIIGSLTKYGNTYELNTGNYILEYSAPSDAPQVPEAPTSTLTVSQAINDYLNKGYSGEATVKGIISEVYTYNTSGTMCYYIKDSEDSEDELYVYNGLNVEGEKFTNLNNLAVGGTIEVKGNILLFNGTTPEINSNNQVISYTAPANVPAAPSTTEGVLTVAQALDLINVNSWSGNISVKGYVTEVGNLSQNGNLSYYIGATADATTTLYVYNGLNVNGLAFNDETKLSVGDEVTVEGYITRYSGNPQLAAGSQLVGDENTPVIKPSAEIITVAEALELIEQGYRSEATVSGIITKVGSLGNSGGITYWISDENVQNELEVYYGMGLEGKAFSAATDIVVNAKVVVKGTLTLYNNNTPEFNSGSEMLSYTAPTGSETTPPDSGNEGEEGELTGETVEFDFADFLNLNATLNGVPYQYEEGATEYKMTDVIFSAGPIKFVGVAPEGTSANSLPRLFKNSNGEWTYRFYKNSTLTIAADNGYYINGIVFDAKNLGNASVQFLGEGEFDSPTKTWTAYEGADVTMVTITKSESGNNPEITSFVVYYRKGEGSTGGNGGGEGGDTEGDGGTTAIDNLDSENAPVVFYNLQGLKVKNPVKGQIYIVNGKKVIY